MHGMRPEAARDAESRSASLGRGDLSRWRRELYPICRSITGDGVRETLDVLSRHIALSRHEVPTGTRRLRLDDPERVEHPRRLSSRTRPATRVVDFARPQPARA